jgi:hypothetical protein
MVTVFIQTRRVHFVFWASPKNTRWNTNIVTITTRKRVKHSHCYFQQSELEFHVLFSSAVFVALPVTKEIGKITKSNYTSLFLFSWNFSLFRNSGCLRLQKCFLSNASVRINLIAHQSMKADPTFNVFASYWFRVSWNSSTQPLLCKASRKVKYHCFHLLCVYTVSDKMYSVKS